MIANAVPILNGDVDGVRQLRLADRDAQLLYAFGRSLEREYGTAGNPAFLREARVIAQEFPGSVRKAVIGLGGRESQSGALLVSGHKVSEGLGDTPGHWRNGSDEREARNYEFLVTLYCALAGDPFAWSTQQDGRLVHDVLPIRAHETEQLGSGSRVELTLHSEDAFHDFRPDFVVLLALRNPAAIETTLASVRWFDSFDPILFEPLFKIFPDNSHQARYNAAPPSQARLDRYADPEPCPVLTERQGITIRIDAYFTQGLTSNAESAIRDFDGALRQRAVGCALMPGDVLLLDNHLVVHGRRPYSPQYDGGDRWLKRGICLRDIRRADAVRNGWVL